MYCMKCGREIPEGQVFCDSCRSVMEQYPVRPGIAVQLPKRRQDPAPVKKTRRRAALSMEEKMIRMKRQNRFLVTFISVLVALCMGVGCLLVYHFHKKQGYRPGQNYSTMDPTERYMLE